MVKEIQVTVEIKPSKLRFPEIPMFQYRRSLQSEIDKGNLTRKGCLELLEQMFAIRTFEEMIAEIVAGIYAPLPKFKYVGPTHISIGQEATSTGSIYALGKEDYITSSHRGHGDAIAKGYSVIKQMSDAELRELLSKRERYLRAINEDLRSAPQGKSLKKKP